jgi:hypothetical protein
MGDTGKPGFDLAKAANDASAHAHTGIEILQCATRGSTAGRRLPTALQVIHARLLDGWSRSSSVGRVDVDELGLGQRSLASRWSRRSAFSCDHSVVQLTLPK